MNTAIIIVSASLIVLAGVNIWLLIRYLRKKTECELKLQELASREETIATRETALKEWSDKLQKKAKEIGKLMESRKHVYANYEVLDSAETKPSAKTIGKSLSSKIGYALRHEFPDIAERHDNVKGGRTVYSVDFYVTKYE